VRLRLLNLLTALSLLLCVAAAVLWSRSYWAFDQFLHQRPDGQGRLAAAQVSSYRGALVVQTTRLDQGFAGSERSERFLQHTRLPARPDWSAYDPTVARVVLGFGSGSFRYRIATGPPGSPGAQIIWGAARFVVVPYYAPVALAAVLPLARAGRAWKRRRERQPGQCRVCGYDLRATPDRCPECGAAAPRPSRA
jgi:hypothetical protein